MHADDSDDADTRQPARPTEGAVAREEAQLKEAREAEELHRRLQGQGSSSDQDEKPVARERSAAVDEAFEETRRIVRRD